MVRRAGAAGIVGVAAMGIVLALGASEPTRPPARPAAVVNASDVLDGDSFVVTTGRATIEMRLYDVDCPEYDTTAGERAKALTRRLILGQRVWVFPAGRRPYGVRGRRLVRVWLPEGGWLADALLRAGLARRYVDPDRPGLGLRPPPRPTEPVPPESSEPSRPNAGTEKDDAADPIVYVTASGTKYHTLECRHVSRSATPLRRSAARAQGYASCKLCRPDG